MDASRNPFRASQIESIPYVFTRFTLESLVEKLHQQKYRGAVVGPQGVGKTTLLELLFFHFQKKGVPVDFLSVEHGTFSIIPFCRLILSYPNKTILFVDGADSLSLLKWAILRMVSYCRYGGLVLTSHRSGMVADLVQCESSFPLFIDLLPFLVSGSAMLSDQEYLRALYEQHEGNIRSCFRALYDQFSDV